MPKKSGLTARRDLQVLWSNALAIAALELTGGDAVTKADFQNATIATVQLYCGPEGADIGTEGVDSNRTKSAPEKKLLYWDLVVAWRKKNNENHVVEGDGDSARKKSGQSGGAKAGKYHSSNSQGITT